MYVLSLIMFQHFNQLTVMCMTRDGYFSFTDHERTDLQTHIVFIVQTLLWQYYSNDPGVVKDSKSYILQIQGSFNIVSTQGLCNFDLTCTYKGDLSKLL